MSQLNYERDLSVGFEGALADSHNIDSASGCIQTGEAAKANMAFGRAVMRGSSDRQVAALTAGAKVFGFLKHKHVEEGEIVDGENVTILRKGSMYVVVLDDVTTASDVFVEVATGRVSGVSGAGKIHMKGCEFETAALAGELAVLDINLPSEQEVIA